MKVSAPYPTLQLTSLLLLLLLSLIATAELPALQDRKYSIEISTPSTETGSLRVSIDQIEALGLHQVTTFNPYEDRVETYSGVWMKDFVRHFASTEAQKMTLRAVDDYSIEFEPQEWNQLRILMATRTNGRKIGYDQKGPIRIIFPDYDAKSEVYKVNLPKWMWMINKVEFE